MTTPLETAEGIALQNEAANLVEAGKPMYGIRYGAGYEDGLDVVEIAKRIRGQLRQLAKSGHSPLSGSKASVRINRFAGGRSIDVNIDLPFPVDNPNHDHMSADPAERAYLTPAASAAKELATDILNGYNFDGSDSMTDYSHVNYYGHVVVYEMKE